MITSITLLFYIGVCDVSQNWTTNSITILRISSMCEAHFFSRWWRWFNLINHLNLKLTNLKNARWRSYLILIVNTSEVRTCHACQSIFVYLENLEQLLHQGVLSQLVEPRGLLSNHVAQNGQTVETRLILRELNFNFVTTNSQCYKK